MSLQIQSVNNIIIFTLIFIRIGSTTLTLPFLNSRNVPSYMKILMILTISFGVYPSVQSQDILVPESYLTLSLLAIGECLVGLIIGFVAQVFFISVQLAGELISQQIGLSMATTLNPLNESQNSIMTNFLYILSALVFFSSSSHHWFILSIAESLRAIPIMEFSLPNALGPAFLTFISKSFISAVKISAPVLVMLLLVAIGIGILARLVPQMNIFILSFPINLGAGLLVVSVALIYILHEMRSVFEQMKLSLFLVIRLVGQG